MLRRYFMAGLLLVAILFIISGCVLPTGTEGGGEDPGDPVGPIESFESPEQYEAEFGITTGDILGPGRTVGTPAGEASGRYCVRLNATGEYVQWTVTQAANGLVVRYSVPDTSGGGGQNYTISVYRNGTQHLTNLTVTSKYAWLYGNESTPTDSPASGSPRKNLRRKPHPAWPDPATR